MSYPGGKGSYFTRIINLIPPHEVYIESHLGSGAVLHNIRPAKINIGIDLDLEIIRKYQKSFENKYIYYHGDAIEIISKMNLNKNTIIYADPPYLMSTRKSKKKLYKYEYSKQDHLDLLKFFKNLECNIIISGYESDLYSGVLDTWNKCKYKSHTQNGFRDECLWFNYNIPIKLHDYRFLGDTFRERELIKKRHANLKKKIHKLSLIERNKFIEWIKDKFIDTEV